MRIGEDRTGMNTRRQEKDKGMEEINTDENREKKKKR